MGSDLPEIARIIREYGVGEVVNPADPASIAEGIARLLEDPVRYACARDNTARVVAAYNWEQESARLVALYRQLERDVG